MQEIDRNTILATPPRNNTMLRPVPGAGKSAISRYGLFIVSKINRMPTVKRQNQALPQLQLKDCDE